MATQIQIEANRRNAQKSTGPCSAEGKAVARLNALKSGIDAQTQVIRGEDAGILEQLALEYHARFRPATPEQCLLVDELINSEWLLRRFRRVEAELWAHNLKGAYNLDRKNPLGHIFDFSHTSFTRLQRRIDSAQRNYHRSLEELRRLQSQPAPPPEPQPVAPAAGAPVRGGENSSAPIRESQSDQQLANENGFVPKATECNGRERAISPRAA